MEMMTVQLFVALLPVHRLSALGEAQLTVTLLLTMILLLVLAIPHQLVDMQILHAPPVLTPPYNKLSEEAQASTMVTMSVFPFIIRPVTVLMMHTTMVEAPGINIESVLMLRTTTGEPAFLCPSLFKRSPSAAGIFTNFGPLLIEK